MTRLDPALWRKRPGLPRLLAVLDAPDGATRIVGGAVRDWLFGLAVSDIDLATRLRPADVLARLAAADIKAVPTGLAHGTVTAVVGGQPHEVTTLRQDVESHGRHATVAFTDDWQADAARRDFTINALYADPNDGTVIDHFGGLDDLATRTVRFIGDPLQRIAEDHLRILRFFRFSARFSPSLEPAGLAACAARANDLMALSRERIRDELLKMLTLPDPAPTVGVMLTNGIMAPVLPEIVAGSDTSLAALIARETAARAPGNGIRRLASLLPPDSEIAADIAGRLRLSRAERVRLVHAADRAPVPSDPRALAYAIGGDAALDRMLLTADPRAPIWAGPFAAYTRPRLPLTGKDLIAMGLPPGPAVSRKLAEVEQQWVAQGFPPEPHATAIARSVLGVR